MKINKFIAKFILVFLVISVLPVRFAFVSPINNNSNVSQNSVINPVSVSVAEANTSPAIKVISRPIECQLGSEDNNWSIQAQGKINFNQPADCFSHLSVAVAPTQNIKIAFLNLETPNIRVVSNSTPALAKNSNVLPSQTSKEIALTNLGANLNSKNLKFISLTRKAISYKSLAQTQEKSEAYKILRC